MPITRHHSGRWLYQFDRVIAGTRQRANRLLPQGWTRAQAQAYDQRESARLYELATGGGDSDHLIEDAVLHYLKDHSPTGKHALKNHADIQAALALLHPFYAGLKLSQLGDVVSDFLKNGIGVSKGGRPPQPLSKGTKRNRLAYLQSACRYYWKTALKKKGQNPADLMDLPTVQNARHVYLTRAQALPVFRAMGYGWSRDAARVAFYTGWRISEVLGAEAVETPDGWVLTIPDSKNGQPRVVPVHPRVVHLVRGHWPPQVTKWTASKQTKKALRAVGLGHARLHDLRHSAASEMINAGVDLYTVGGVLGHKSAVSTARYAHLATERLRMAVGKIGGRAAKNPQPGPEAKAA
jgi:integrase